MFSFVKIPSRLRPSDVSGIPFLVKVLSATAHEDSECGPGGLTLF